jgi:hypothetical protein
MKRQLLLLLLAAGLLTAVDAPAQGFLKKLKEKVNEVADKAVDKKVNEKVGAEQGSTPANTSNDAASRAGKPQNKTGAGLQNSTPPDVAAQIVDAEKSHASGNYSDARYSIQQALLGVELQIGKQLLKSMPVTAGGLAADTASDRVVSTRWGWANLTIQRVYGKEDKQMTVVVGNNPLYSGAMDMYFNAGMYAQTNEQDKNQKQVKVQGNKAVIKFDKDEGYTLLVQLGQSGMMTWSAVNFASEQEVMSAVNAFDIERVKKILGEK